MTNDLCRKETVAPRANASQGAGKSQCPTKTKNKTQDGAQMKQK